MMLFRTHEAHIAGDTSSQPALWTYKPGNNSKRINCLGISTDMKFTCSPCKLCEIAASSLLGCRASDSHGGLQAGSTSAALCILHALAFNQFLHAGLLMGHQQKTEAPALLIDIGGLRCYIKCNQVGHRDIDGIALAILRRDEV